MMPPIDKAPEMEATAKVRVPVKSTVPLCVWKNEYLLRARYLERTLANRSGSLAMERR
jgi:hypothetical protein